ncbi:isopentenyl-diphosphate Delta-isomerase 1-like [Nilaparvata lugens]|uniref:isopentenyl-diphosphate Delta-isomerase 1-like n=1 Tax=Nilaparvata lugens TaxID=108931 RepID=UPI00193CD8FD|nr:isopentenyl-diphosphate Delta-isomerase 1-like [Nilaparvata lugens]
MLLQKRSASKVTFPGYVSNACCSHPLHEFREETVETNASGVKMAAGRRLEYELGIPRIHTQPASLHYLTRIHYKSVGDGTWGEHEIDYILVLHKDLPIVPNANEVSDVYYVAQTELPAFLDTLDAPLTPWFASILKSEKLHHWWNNLHRLDSVVEHDKIHKL